MKQQIKAVLFDIDGVILEKNPFSKRLAKEFNVPEEKITPFFQNEFKLCSRGKSDLKEELKKYLVSWNWEKSLDELVFYWLNGEKTINEKILKTVKNLREKGIKCYLVSDQEKYRAEFLLNKLGLGKLFDGHFISCQIGYTKSDNEFFHNIIKALNPILPQEMMFWDDEEKKLEIPKNLGINAKLYQNFEEFEKEISISEGYISEG